MGGLPNQPLTSFSTNIPVSPPAVCSFETAHSTAPIKNGLTELELINLKNQRLDKLIAVANIIDTSISVAAGTITAAMGAGNLGSVVYNGAKLATTGVIVSIFGSSSSKRLAKEQALSFAISAIGGAAHGLHKLETSLSLAEPLSTVYLNNLAIGSEVTREVVLFIRPVNSQFKMDQGFI